MYKRIGTVVPLTYTELKSWSELTATPLEPYEVDALMALDRLYWSIVHGG